MHVDGKILQRRGGALLTFWRERTWTMAVRKFCYIPLLDSLSSLRVSRSMPSCRKSLSGLHECRSGPNIAICAFLPNPTSSSAGQCSTGTDGDVKPAGALLIFKFIISSTAADQGTIPKTT